MDGIIANLLAQYVAVRCYKFVLHARIRYTGYMSI